VTAAAEKSAAVVRIKLLQAAGRAHATAPALVTTALPAITAVDGQDIAGRSAGADGDILRAIIKSCLQNRQRVVRRTVADGAGRAAGEDLIGKVNVLLPKRASEVESRDGGARFGCSSTGCYRVVKTDAADVGEVDAGQHRERVAGGAAGAGPALLPTVIAPPPKFQELRSTQSRCYWTSCCHPPQADAPDIRIADNHLVAGGAVRANGEVAAEETAAIGDDQGIEIGIQPIAHARLRHSQHRPSGDAVAINSHGIIVGRTGPLLR